MLIRRIYLCTKEGYWTVKFDFFKVSWCRYTLQFTVSCKLKLHVLLLGILVRLKTNGFTEHIYSKGKR